MKWRILTVSAALMVATSVCLSGQDKIQEGRAGETAEPNLTDQERATIQKETNPAKRARKLLDIAKGRLAQAQTLMPQEQYAEAGRLVQDYTAILSYTMALIDSLPRNDRKRQRSAYKDFDLRVRKQIPTLEELKRSALVDMPAIETALSTAQRLRIVALNGFSGAEIMKVPEQRP